MRKKIFEGFNKIKNKFENLKDNISQSDEHKTKEIKNNIDYLINEFSNLNLNNEKKLDNEIDYYYKLNENEESPILLVAVIGFHHKKGSIVESFYPPKEEIFKTHSSFFENILSNTNDSNLINVQVDKILDDILNQLTYFCLPDAVHNTNEDAQFFFIQNYKTLLYGISCYRQIKTSSIEVDDENTRDCVQKAMCIVSKAPLFGHYYSKLSSTMSAFFSQNTLKDKLIIKELYDNYESISFKNLNINEIFMSFSLRKLFMFSKEKIFTLIKLILLEKKIIVYSNVSNNVCSFILSLISLIPGNSLFNLNLGNSVKNFMKSLKMYGLPLRTHNTNAKLFPLFTLFDFDQIENLNSFLVGTTNQMILNHNKIKYDCIVNIDHNKITINNDIPEKILKITKEEKNIFTKIFNKLKNNFNDSDENWMVNINLYEPLFEGSDDFIRNEFKNYFYDFLTDLSLSIHITNNKEILHLSIASENESGSNTSEEEDSNENNFDKNSKKLIKQKKEQEKNLCKSIKKILNLYNIDFISSWTQTTNFKFWVNNHDKNLCMRSIYVKMANNITMIYDNGDVYIGSLSRGKKNGFGVLNEFSSNSVYNGYWENDMKSRTGCLTSHDNKNIYDGEWKENKKHGQGQWINNKIKYSGTFKNDMYHGNGILCDSNGNMYEGDFINGNFEGMGHYKMHTGETYIGQFVNKLFEGKGQLTHPDGTIYNGDFYQSKKHGEGLFMMSNGDKYEGTFSDDKFEGDGIYTYSSGEIKKGLWKSGNLLKEDE